VTPADRYPTRVAGPPVPLDRPDPVVWGDRPGPLTPDELAAHDRDGFVVVPRLLAPDEVAALVDELDRLVADPAVRADERTVLEEGSDAVRSLFEVHRLSAAVAALAADERVAGRARQVLGSDVHVHQSRLNRKPGGGAGFAWHSDFETWHAEDGMPAPRAVSIAIALTENTPHNGPLVIVPGSHRTFVPCVGATPAAHHRTSLRRQEIGVPDPASLAALVDRHGVAVLTGAPGSAVLFDANCLHGSDANTTARPRSNLFLVLNSVDNALVQPFAAPAPRPEHLAARDVRAV
jgi:ectoine hydroxylase